MQILILTPIIHVTQDFDSLSPIPSTPLPEEAFTIGKNKMRYYANCQVALTCKINVNSHLCFPSFIQCYQ